MKEKKFIKVWTDDQYFFFVSFPNKIQKNSLIVFMLILF